MARFSPIMRDGARVRRARRPGARHLQRLSDSARGGPAAGRDAAQPRPEVSAASTCTCASSRPTRRSPRACARGPGAAACRSRHGEGNYFAPPDDARRGSRRTARWSSATPIRSGDVDDDGEPEWIGRTRSPALCNEGRNVVGLMPHPERACEAVLGSADGLRDFRIGRAGVRVGTLALQGARAMAQRDDRSPRFSNGTASSPTSTTASSRSWAASRT